MTNPKQVKGELKSIARVTAADDKGRELFTAVVAIRGKNRPDQAHTLQETTSSMHELTQIVRKNTQNTQVVNQAVASASRVAVKGGAVVSRVVTTMGAIDASSKKIADIIGVMDAIAFQTNILALNAAVEAERAGEQSRGFAVVASDVRSLAQLSAKSAKKTKALIEQSVSNVKTGTRLVVQAGTTMTEVVDSAMRVTTTVADLTNVRIVQTAGIERVNESIVRMDEVTATKCRDGRKNNQRRPVYAQ